MAATSESDSGGSIAKRARKSVAECAFEELTDLLHHPAGTPRSADELDELAELFVEQVSQLVPKLSVTSLGLPHFLITNEFHAASRILSRVISRWSLSGFEDVSSALGQVILFLLIYFSIPTPSRIASFCTRSESAFLLTISHFVRIFVPFTIRNITSQIDPDMDTLAIGVTESPSLSFDPPSVYLLPKLIF